MKWYILAFLLSVAGLSILGNNTQTEAEHKLARLNQLQQRAIAFDQNTPVDTVIKWGGLLIPYLEQEGRFIELSSIRQLVSVALCEKGFAGMATQMVDTLMQHAQQAKEYLCMSIALHSTGKLFMAFNLQKQAMETYRKAMELLQNHPPDDPVYIKRILLDMLRCSLMTSDTNQAGELIDELTPYFTLKAADPLFSLFLIHKSRYEIILHEEEAARNDLEWVRIMLDADHLNKGNTTIAYYHFVLGLYHEMVGEYRPALQEFNRLVPGVVPFLTASRRNEVAGASARVFEKIGQPEKACALMRQIIAWQDSVNSINNSLQINTLRTRYQVVDYVVEHRLQANKVMLWLIIILACIALVIIGISIVLNYMSRKLEKIQKLEKDEKSEAESSIQSKSMLLSNMSHEIRTPLHAITGFSAVITDKNTDDVTRRQSVDIIRRNSELLIKLIDDIINLSNMEFGRMEFNFAIEDAVSICKDVIETVDHLKHSHVAFVLQSDQPSFLIETDRTRLQQVLNNLLVNATKYTHEGSITLTLTPYNEDYLQFTVTDTGCGISPQYQKKIFNRFEKPDELKPGTGLGLAICRLIITQIGGRIWLDPTYTDGAKFCFTHPMAQKANTIVR